MPAPLVILAPILPDLSKRINTFAGTSPIPDPGGKAFENALPVSKRIDHKILIIKNFDLIN
jgi:hypothetical protein